jgi:hypothetical protein
VEVCIKSNNIVSKWSEVTDEKTLKRKRSTNWLINALNYKSSYDTKVLNETTENERQYDTSRLNE